MMNLPYVDPMGSMDICYIVGLGEQKSHRITMIERMRKRQVLEEFC